jgi:hypothetical protein
MRVERSVVLADAGMVAPDDEVRAAVVLPEKRVQQGLARPGVAHVERVARLDHRAATEVLLDQHGDGARAHLRRDVARLHGAKQRVHQHAVAYLDRRLDQLLVRALHRVACLERGDPAPAQALELGARLGRRHEERPVLCLEAAVGQYLHRAGEVHVRLLSDHRDARMRAVRGAEHRAALARLVDRVGLAHLHGGERRAAFRVGQRDFVAGFDRSIVGGKRDRDRPENSGGGAIAFAHAFPVGARHEAVERCEAADAEHDEIALLARADAHRAQGPRARQPGGERLAGQRERPEPASTMGRNETTGQELLLACSGKKKL